MAENKVLKIGIIGCGGIANGKHMPNIRKVKGVEMVAFCDIEETKAAKAAREYGTPDAKVYAGTEESYKKLLEDKTIDVVHVLTPNISHSTITVDSLEAGKHVMCEKPMAINSAEAKKMLDAAKKTGKKLTIGYQARHRNDTEYLKQEIKDGTLGEIYFARAHAVRRRAVPTWGVFLDKEKQGGGPLIDIGTHALDLTLYLMNNYKPKYCVGTTYQKQNKPNNGNAWGDWDIKNFDVEDSAFGFVVMEDGATISLDACWALNTLQVGESMCTLCGTEAGADMWDGLRINGVRNGRQYTFKPSFEAGGVAFYDGDTGGSPEEKEQKRWYNSIRNDIDPMVTPEQAIVVTQILEGIYESAKTGQPYYINK